MRETNCGGFEFPALQSCRQYPLVLLALGLRRCTRRAEREQFYATSSRAAIIYQETFQECFTAARSRWQPVQQQRRCSRAGLPARSRGKDALARSKCNEPR